MSPLRKTISSSCFGLLLIMVVMSSVSSRSEEYYDDSFDADQPSIQRDSIHQPAVKRAAVFLDKLIMAVRRGSRNGKSSALQAPKVHLVPGGIVDVHNSEPKHSGISNLQRNLLEVNTNEPNAKHFVSYPQAVVVRRGQKNGRTFWRCYFNAVSCFRKK